MKKNTLLIGALALLGMNSAFAQDLVTSNWLQMLYSMSVMAISAKHPPQQLFAWEKLILELMGTLIKLPELNSHKDGEISE